MCLIEMFHAKSLIPATSSSLCRSRSLRPTESLLSRYAGAGGDKREPHSAKLHRGGAAFTAEYASIIPALSAASPPRMDSIFADAIPKSSGVITNWRISSPRISTT
jgi:hypothetical protein